jgi:transposase InsO family protein
MRTNPKEIIALLQAGHTAKEVAEETGVSIRTVRRWKKRAVSPNTLRLSQHCAKRKSTRPHSAPRLEALSRNQKERIKELRIESGWGAERIQHVLGIEASDRAIHRFLLKEGLVQSTAYRRPRYQDTTHKGLHNVTEPGTLQMDVKYVTPHLSGMTHTTYLYAGIDLFTRYRAAWIYEPLDSRTAAEALEWILYSMPFPISFIQTDNGLEFQGQFQRALQLFELPHHFIHKASPNENAVVERAFRTDDEEFFTHRLPRSGRPSDLAELNTKYQEWLTVYNTARPHHGLGFRTPIQMVPTWMG